MSTQDEENQRRAQRQLMGSNPVESDNEVDLYRLVFSHLEQLPQQSVSADFADRVMKRVVKKQPLYRESLFYGLLFVAILASLVVGLVLAGQFDGHVVANLSAVLYRSSWWLLLGLLFFIGSQWLDQQAFVEQLKHKPSSPPTESLPN